MSFIGSFKEYKRKREEKLFERAELASIQETQLRKSAQIKAERHEKIEAAKAKIKSVKAFKSKGRKEFFGKIAKGISREAGFIKKAVGPVKSYKPKTHKPIGIKPYKPMQIKPQKHKPW